MVLGAVFAATAASASGGGGENQVEMVEFFSSGFMWAVINFSLIAFLIYHFGKEPLKEALRNRQETIAKTMEDASAARAMAEEALEEARKRVAEKDSVVQEILNEASEKAERQKRALVEQGDRMSKDIVERAKISVDLELKRAKDELKAEAALLAVELAEKKIREETTAEDQSRLLREYIAGMESRN